MWWRVPLEKKNAEKIFKRLSRLGYKAKIAPNMVIPVLWQLCHFAEAVKVKKVQKTDNHSWLLIQSL
jgi:hypothetical protein